MASVTLEQLKTHNKENDCWLLIHGKVYDVSKFAEDHPGGEEILFEHGGKDCSVAFDDISHSNDAVKLLLDYYVGDFAK